MSHENIIRAWKDEEFRTGRKDAYLTGQVMLYFSGLRTTVIALNRIGWNQQDKRSFFDELV